MRIEKNHKNWPQICHALDPPESRHTHVRIDCCNDDSLDIPANPHHNENKHRVAQVCDVLSIRHHIDDTNALYP